jgi:hypothetical protein
MRKSNQQSIGELLSAFVKENKLDSRLQEVELISTWKKIAGEYIANHTTEIKIYKGVLHLQLDSPACREELMYKRTEVMNEINKVAGKLIIKEIVIR